MNIQKHSEDKILPEAWEKLLVQGELQQLTSEQRAKYYLKVCDSLGLNHLTRPFDYISFQGKLQLYARKDCTDQLRRNRQVSIRITDRNRSDDMYIVTAQATDAQGRVDEAIGALSIAGLKGLELANALMKCETKAKRRVTLSICGLGFLDESETDDIPTRIEPAAPPDYLPGILPKCTAEMYVDLFSPEEGGMGKIAECITRYRQKPETTKYAEQLLKAATEAGMKFEGPTHPGVSPVNPVSEAELFPFEKKKE